VPEYAAESVVAIQALVDAQGFKQDGLNAVCGGIETQVRRKRMAYPS
jgi:hypothetical protein